MGYIPKSSETYAVAYLTEIGRSYLFNKNNNRFDSVGDDLFEITKFALSDSDTNYLSSKPLESGDVPDVTGNKSSGCLKTCANYVQTNLVAYVFDSSPSTVTYSTNLPGGSSPELEIPEGGIPPISPGENPPPFTPLTLPGSLLPPAIVLSPISEPDAFPILIPPGGIIPRAQRVRFT